MTGELHSAPTRQLVHGRKISCRAYRRADGRWEIEGRLCDVRTHDLQLPGGASVPAGEPYRELALTVIVDGALTIHDARIDAGAPARRCWRACRPRAGR